MASASQGRVALRLVARGRTPANRRFSAARMRSRSRFFCLLSDCLSALLTSHAPMVVIFRYWRSAYVRDKSAPSASAFSRIGRRIASATIFRRCSTGVKCAQRSAQTAKRSRTSSLEGKPQRSSRFRRSNFAAVNRKTSASSVIGRIAL